MTSIIGTISHGTLRPQDLLRSFSEAYKQYCQGEGFLNALYEEAQNYADLLDRNNGTMTDEDHETLSEVLDALIEHLEVIAARHDCYFGAIEGDASDFGFWPNDGGEA